MTDFTQGLKIAKFLVKYASKFNFELDLNEWPIINYVNFSRVAYQKSNRSEENTKILKIANRYIGKLTEYHEIFYNKFWNRFFSEWMEEINQEIPSLATRIFKLRKFTRTRELEKDLGLIMSKLNNDFINFWHGQEGAGNQVTLEFTYDMLLETLNKAERELKKHEIKSIN